jgi:ferredoxin-like protein FixX
MLKIIAVNQQKSLKMGTCEHIVENSKIEWQFKNNKFDITYPNNTHL